MHTIITCPTQLTKRRAVLRHRRTATAAARGLTYRNTGIPVGIFPIENGNRENGQENTPTVSVPVPALSVLFSHFPIFPRKWFTIGLDGKQSRLGRNFPVPFSTLATTPSPRARAAHMLAHTPTRGTVAPAYYPRPSLLDPCIPRSLDRLLQCPPRAWSCTWTRPSASPFAARSPLRCRPPRLQPRHVSLLLLLLLLRAARHRRTGDNDSFKSKDRPIPEPQPEL